MSEEQNIHQLPKDWKWVKLGEECEVITGTTPPKSDLTNYGNDVPFFKPPHLWDGLVTDTDERLSFKGASKARVAPANTVLVTCIGNLGRTGYLKKEAAFNQQINAILENENILGKYVFYQAHSPLFRKQLEKLATGTTVSIVNKGNFETIQIPLPPKPIQQAIVSKIEELFSELDKGIEQLKTTQQQLKTYRQAVLKWAFEGKLTRSLNRDSYDLYDGHDVTVAAELEAGYNSKNNQSNQDNHTNQSSDKGALPEGWRLQKLNDIGTWKGGGTPSKANKSFWEKGNILWVSPKDMKSKVIHDTVDKITSEAIENSSAKLINKGSILFVVRSGILRRTLPVAITICDVTVNQDLQALTPKEVSSDYVYWYVQSKNEDIRKHCSKDGTTVESIESSLLKNYLIPVCSKEEQNQIVQEIESRLSVADKMEESINQSLRQSEMLRQSILKKAFNGELVT